MKVVVKELVPSFVGEVNEFPITAVDEQVIREFREAWTRYPVIRFRGVEIGDREQVAFSRMLGPHVFHPRQLQQGKHAESKDILVISNKKNPDGSEAGALGDREVNWHTDTTFVERPPSAAILRAVQLPKEGGNTYWANMYSAYDALPDAMKTKLRGLYIHHQSILDGVGELRLGRKMPSTPNIADWPGVEHPIVRRHADSGKLCLFLATTPPERLAIRGMPQDEAQDLLRELWRLATLPDHIWHTEWKVGDMMMWDNRCTLHRRDPFDPSSVRLMHRTTVEGERPVAA